MAFSGITIYLVEAEGNYKKLGSNLDRVKLVTLSDLAAEQLEGKASKDPRNLKNSVTLFKGNNPKHLSLKGLGIEEFNDVVFTYATAYAFKLKREYRGDDLRNAIYDYMHQGSLTWQEFSMIEELLGWDGGLVKTARHEVIFRWCKGGTYIPPDMEKILEYAEKAGFKDELMRIKVEMQKGMRARDERDARKAKVLREVEARAAADA
ncbi:hypothetical protein BAUCODRAFT_152854 [Baudoinia panamericana UAMH 10762]|uniref:Uncharacterized protein n=1 Tax=Baudoinia panamericana (strain UAMH 10762) TaxID=717646 RepID=M2M2W4_BAUPA|nr:uncharacterized protein BAUCODRAFT_152854 [Baudoinia panamericana UAMH 10762]EMC90871.1 hypothetical protein BAUCODRAFT_152854 [Baudoinia panamericana UAMH 10762]